MGRKLRHKIENNYSIRAFTVDGKIVDLNTENWKEQNVKGLVGLTKSQAPNWKKLEIQKYTYIFDTVADKPVAQKQSSLVIGRIGI